MRTGAASDATLVRARNPRRHALARSAAILDRLVHGATRFELHGTSMRTDDAGAGTKA